MTDKTVMITIAGRANAGKSTLTNKLTGDRITIVSPKPQTTRNRIYGIFKYKNTQIVLLDTPGFHKAKTRLGDYMVGIVKKSVADVDAVMLLVEPVANIGQQERELIAHIKSSGVPCILIINKIDTISYDSILPVIALYSQYYEFEEIIPVSAKTGEGVEKLPAILEKYGRKGPQLFPDDMTTDQPEKQVVAEIIREKLLLCLDKEVPHGTAVEITTFSERESKEPIIDVEAIIYCEKQSHKGMIIGKNGEKLKKIGQYARADIERFMGAKVFLKTWVKVAENWRDSSRHMKNFGYTE